MPELNDIKAIWRSTADKTSANESLDADAIERAIANQSISISSKLLKTISSGIAGLTICMVLFGYNVYGYASNDFLLAASIFCLMLSSALTVFLFYQRKKFRKLDQADLPLDEMLVKKIEYFKKSLYLVHHTIAICIVLLVFALNLIVDNDGGNYYVNNIWLYIFLEIIAYACMLVILRLSHSVYLKQYRTALGDLENTRLTEMDSELRKHRRKLLIITVILLLLVAAGLIALFTKLSHT